MNRNVTEIKSLISVMSQLKDENELQVFLAEMFTEAELSDLAKRWRILNMLNEGYTQRSISKFLNVSLCKVTRGSRILKSKKSVVKKYLEHN